MNIIYSMIHQIPSNFTEGFFRELVGQAQTQHHQYLQLVVVRLRNFPFLPDHPEIAT